MAGRFPKGPIPLHRPSGTGKTKAKRIFLSAFWEACKAPSICWQTHISSLKFNCRKHKVFACSRSEPGGTVTLDKLLSLWRCPSVWTTMTAAWLWTQIRSDSLSITLIYQSTQTHHAAKSSKRHLYAK